MVKDNEVGFIKRWLYGYLPATGFVALAIFSAVIASSYYFNYSSAVFMEKWSCEGKITKKEEWEKANKSLALSLKISPWDADTHMSLGNLYEWKALSMGLWGDDSLNTRNQAISYFVSALELRPTWADAWVKLAQTMLLNRQLNEETFHAINMAFKFGKHKPELRDKLIWVNLGIWPSLPDDVKQQTREIVKKTLVNKISIKKMATMALRFKWFDELEALLTDPEDVEYLNLLRENPKLLKNAARGMFGNKTNVVCG